MNPTNEHARRWRLILGGDPADGTGYSPAGDDLAVDAALSALYGGGLGAGSPERSIRRGGLGASQPNVARWLGDIRTFFPSSVVRVMQQDALTRLNLTQMLFEPELLRDLVPDVHLVATLLSLKNVIPAKTRDTARQVVRTVVNDLKKKLEPSMRQAVTGSLNKASRSRRPRLREIDWPRTIRANLSRYQAEYHTIVPEVRIGYGRRGSALRNIVLCIDQSGSMASSVVYAGVFGAVLASLPAVSTQFVVFDTAVVDLTASLSDPVDLLFGVQLGGGTDINRALAYCETLIKQPRETILVLIGDLCDGGDAGTTVRRCAEMTGNGIQIVSLLALGDDGAPFFDHAMAEQLAALGIPSFACTPDLFPDLMSAAILRRDIGQWAAAQGIVTSRSDR